MRFWLIARAGVSPVWQAVLGMAGMPPIADRQGDRRKLTFGGFKTSNTRQTGIAGKKPARRPHSPHYTALTLRGGRMTKVAGVAASFAPLMGQLALSVSAVAMGAALTSSGAHAGSCALIAGVYTCSGPADPVLDVTQSFTNPTGVSVVTEPGFGIDTTGTGGSAFFLESGGGTLSFNDQNASNIYGGTGYGIFARGYGTNNGISITSNGVIGGNLRGVRVLNEATGDTQVNLNQAYGSTVGVSIYQSSTGGAVSVSTSGVVSGLIGISVDNRGNQGVDISTTAGVYATTGRAITVSNLNGGAVTVTTGLVSSTQSDAIRVYNGISSADVTITTNGLVTGNQEGIQVIKRGSGTATVTANEAVIGGALGIDITNEAGDIEITAGDVTGTSSRGISTFNDTMSRNTSITSDGTVTGGTAIYATNRGAGDIDIVNTNVSGTAFADGAVTGIEARHYSDGNINVTADRVRGGTADGIQVVNNGGTGSISVTTTGTVDGAFNGITALNDNSGGLEISTQGTVTAGQNGILANNRAGGDLTITSSEIAANLGNGIETYNDASGQNLIINVENSITGGDRGIDAFQRGTGSFDISVTNPQGTAQVTGQTKGIYARHEGTGTLSIVADQVTGVSQYGIETQSSNMAGDASILVNEYVYGGGQAIRAYHTTSGNLDITATNGDGTARVASNGAGIVAVNTVGGRVNINVDQVDATSEGIIAEQSGLAYGPSLSITAGQVLSTTNDGVKATTSSGASSAQITITDGINAGRNGISLYSMGFAGARIRALDGTSISGMDYGIVARNDVSALTIEVDNVDGFFADGINASNLGTDLSISATGLVQGATYGIYAYNSGIGDINITAQDDGLSTVAGGAQGIRALNFTSGGITIAVDEVRGVSIGIYAYNDGTEATYISAIDVDAANGDAIDAYNRPTSTDLSITASGTVSGSRNGIYAIDNGTGDLTIEVYNNAGTAEVVGDDNGIVAVKQNGNSLIVTVDNARATTTGDAIYTYAGPGTYRTSIATDGDIFGARNGIAAYHYGSNVPSVSGLNVYAYGTVNGATGAGILAFADSADRAFVVLSSGAQVSGATFAIENNGSDSTILVEGGAELIGDVSLNDGSDTLAILGATLTNVSLLDGGDDISTGDTFVDRLNFSGFTGTLGADLRNWENISVSGGQLIYTGPSIDTGELVVGQNGRLTVTQPNFVLNGPLVTIFTGTFEAGTGGTSMATLNGRVVNRGRVSLVDGAAGDTLTINGDVLRSGAFELDVDVSGPAADRISIVGNVIPDPNGPKGIAIEGTGSATTPSDITVLDVTGTTTDADFQLADFDFTTLQGEEAEVIGAYFYTLGFDAPVGEYFITPFDQNGNLNLNPAIALFEAYPNLLTNLNALPGSLQRWSDRSGGSQSGVEQLLLDFDPSPENAIWFSFSGRQAEYTRQSTTGAQVESDVTGFEMGMDYPLFDTQSGQMLVGAYFALQEARADLLTTAAAGDINNDAQSLTLHATYLSDSLFYASGQVRFSRFDTDMFISGAPVSVISANAEGLAASFEIGRAFNVSQSLTVVPQFQLAYSDISGDAIADPFGSAFAAQITDGETLTARVGVLAERSFARGSVFGGLSLIHAFDNDTAINFAGLPFVTRPDEQRIEVRAGGQIEIGQNSVFYGGLTAQGGLSDFGDDYAYGVTGGIRVRF
ncbi:MAG: autotransporter outer membrane beta-barrel domain-containing protein [Pseudomonadota bacterium]